MQMRLEYFVLSQLDYDAFYVFTISCLLHKLQDLGCYNIIVKYK